MPFQTKVRACLLVMLLMLGTPHLAWPLPQTKDQQRCINVLYKAGTHISDATCKLAIACVGKAAKGKLPAGQTAEQCIAADAGGAVAKARSNADKAASKTCGSLPDFGPAASDEVRTGYTTAVRLQDLLGRDVEGAIIRVADDKIGAKCQQATLAGLMRIASAKLKEFNHCVHDGLKSGAIASAAELAGCVGADPKGKVAGAVAKLQQSVSRKCSLTSLAKAAPGRCAGSPLGTVAQCLERRVDCGVCLTLAEAGETGIECQPRVDGVRQCTDRPVSTQSIARQWDEEILEAIRHDTPRPTVHARNLFHLSAAMWDAWRAYGGGGSAFLTDEHPPSDDPETDRDIAISYAAYRVLSHRYALSVNAASSQVAFDARMTALDLDKSFTDTTSGSPASLGNRIGVAIIAYGQSDGANEQGNYADPTYTPANEPLIVKLGAPVMADPNRWQPLALDFFQTQNGIPLPDKVQTAIGMRWNQVKPFALTRANPDDVYIDPGPPPRLGTASDADFKAAAVRLIQLGSQLTPDDGETIDLSPSAYGNNPLGSNAGTGHPLNPVTGQPYAPQVVKLGDFGRVLAEFWADGPNSETPPGHWNTLANYVSDQLPDSEKRLAAAGPVLGRLEWDVKLYLAVNGAVHDAGIVAWGLKRKYDSVRPISMVRYMGSLGQSSDAAKGSYDPNGLPLVDGLIELITFLTTSPGGRHQALAGHEGEIAVLGWPGQPVSPATTYQGVRWIRVVNWLPYQKNTFVTPAFPGYTSGHSTFSRAAAEAMAAFTGSPFFPGGLGEFVARANQYLTVELGPTTDVHLQWGTYYDASDQAGQSRLWGGIHISADDFNGRITGSQVGIGAFAKAQDYFNGTVSP